MKILQVIPDFGTGGIQKAGCVLTEAMGRKGHEVLLVAQEGGPRFHPKCSLHRVLSGPPLDSLIRAMREFTPDVLHIHAAAYPEELLLGLSAQLRERPPVLVTTPVFGRPPANRRILSLTRTCCVGAFTFYRLGRWLKQNPDEMIRRGMAYVPLTPFQPPPQEVDRDRQRRALGIPRDAFVFGRIGRNQSGKWHGCYPRIINTILSANPSACWLSIGFPEELGRAQLEQRWGKRFRNFSQTSDYQFLAEVLAVMDVQLFWSQNGECFAATICEASGMGTPTIAAVNPCQDNGQVEQVLDGITGKLVGSASEAVFAINQLASDVRKLEALRTSTRKHAWERWHMDRVAADLLQLYQYWRTGEACSYLEVMRGEQVTLMEDYRNKIAGVKANSRTLRGYGWRTALWLAESWPLFVLARGAKPFMRRIIDWL